MLNIVCLHCAVNSFSEELAAMLDDGRGGDGGVVIESHSYWIRYKEKPIIEIHELL